MLLTQMLSLLLYAACVYVSCLLIVCLIGRRVCESFYLIMFKGGDRTSRGDRCYPIVDKELTHDKVEGESETDDSDTDIDTDIYCDKYEPQESLCEDICTGRQIFPTALRPSEFKCKEM